VRVSGFVPKSGRHFGEKTVLTRKQNELLLFINKRPQRGGVSPSFDEMKEALRLKSKSGIHRLITGLESVASCAACPIGHAPCRS
jgi:hypothetical protein